MSCELLANLAGCLVSDNTVFEIVNSLIDIQHFVEKEMYLNRRKLMNDYSGEFPINVFLTSAEFFFQLKF